MKERACTLVLIMISFSLMSPIHPTAADTRCDLRVQGGGLQQQLLLINIALKPSLTDVLHAQTAMGNPAAFVVIQQVSLSG